VCRPTWPHGGSKICACDENRRKNKNETRVADEAEEIEAEEVELEKAEEG
jgi:hypothetical protein